MPTISIPTALRRYAGEQAAVEVPARPSKTRWQV